MSPDIEFIQTLQKIRFWQVKVGFWVIGLQPYSLVDRRVLEASTVFGLRGLEFRDSVGRV